MGKQQPEPAEALRKPCVICFKLCLPYGRTARGNHICCVDHNNEWYKLTLEEQQRRDDVASTKGRNQPSATTN